jgi:hypothetical protein
MKIVGDVKIKDAGSLESKPVSINWGFRAIGIPAIPWAVLLAVFLVGASRRRQVCWILVPAAIHVLLWFGIEKGMGRAMARQFVDMMVIFDRSMLVATSILWISWLALGVRRALLVFVLIWLSAWGSSLFFSGFNSLYVAGGAIVGGMAALSITFCLALALRMCRSRFSRPRFFLWLFLVAAACGLVFVIPYDHLMSGAISYFASMLGWKGSMNGIERWFFTGVLGIALGGAVYCVMLPFLVPTLLIPFSRREFERLVGSDQ